MDRLALQFLPPQSDCEDLPSMLAVLTDDQQADLRRQVRDSLTPEQRARYDAVKLKREQAHAQQ